MDIKTIAALLTALAEGQDFLKDFGNTVKTVAPAVGETGKTGLSTIVIPILNELTTLAKSEEGKEALNSLTTLIMESHVAIAKVSSSEEVKDSLQVIARSKANNARIIYNAYRYAGFNEQESFSLLLEDRKESNNKKLAQAIGQVFSNDNFKKHAPEELEKSK